MQNETRKVFNAYLERLAHLSGVPDVTHMFSVSPSVQQTLETQMQESSQFLKQINMIGVDELKGEKIGLGVSGPIAGRTDVSANDRAPRDMSTLNSDLYECESTEFDTYLSWSKLDAWAKFPDFQRRLRDAIIRRQALDRIMIGFNGTSAAGATDRATNPLLQDVNIGWLQKYRDNAPERVLDSGATAGQVGVGAGATADYKTYDALVYDAVNSLLDAWFRESTDLICVVSHDLLVDRYLPELNSTQAPTEQIAREKLVKNEHLAALPAMRAPFFPSGTILITAMDNLSLYWQRGSRRRHLVENPKRKRVENYESSNDAYVVEDYGYGCLIENITEVAA